MNLWRFLAAHVERTPDKVLLQTRVTHQTYTRFFEDAERAARALQSAGARRGDAVCLMLANSPEYLHLWFGLARIGAVKVPINVHLKGDGFAHIVNHSEAETLVIDADLIPRLQELSGLARLKRVIVVGGDEPLPPGVLRWSDLLAAGGTLPDGPLPDQNAVHAILYTSGTTGPAKGVMLSHHAYLHSAAAFVRQFVPATEEDVFYSCLPLFHINAQAHTALPAMLLNATMAIGERFSASAFWSEIAGHRATIFNLLGAMIPILCKQSPGALDRAHGGRIAACAATPKAVWREFEARFGVRIIEGYGLTETAGFCVSNRSVPAVLGSIGTPMDFVEARVDDGEILLRATTPHAFMEGYYRMPEQTAAAMRDGWFHTGDMGSMDEAGNLYFADRIKQSIRRRGENISSWDIETVVSAHPHVLESAAVGVPSELGEEEVKICVVLRPGMTMEPVEIVQWCETRMAYFMVPRYVEIRESLPKTATERVEKYKLKQDGAGAAWDRQAAGYVLKRT